MRKVISNLVIMYCYLILMLLMNYLRPFTIEVANLSIFVLIIISLYGLKVMNWLFRRWNKWIKKNF